MIYTITTLKTIYGYRNPVHTYEYLGCRCVGFFYELDEAQEAVLNNYCDIHENNYYPFCVIEGVREGMYNIGGHGEWWYQWIDGKYKLIDKPETLKQVVGFGIG